MTTCLRPRRVVDEIVAAGGEAVADDNDVVDGAAAIVPTALDAFGGVDIVVNNAGIGAGTPIGPDAGRGVAPHHRHQPLRLDRRHRRGVGAPGPLGPRPCGDDVEQHVVRGDPHGGLLVGQVVALRAHPLAGGRGARVGIAVNAILPAAWTRLVAGLPPGPVAELMETRFPPRRWRRSWRGSAIPRARCPARPSASAAGRRRGSCWPRRPAWCSASDADPAGVGRRRSTSCSPSTAWSRRASSTDEVSWMAHTLGGEVPEAFRPGGAARLGPQAPLSSPPGPLVPDRRPLRCGGWGTHAAGTRQGPGSARGGLGRRDGAHGCAHRRGRGCRP